MHARDEGIQCGEHLEEKAMLQQGQECRAGEQSRLGRGTGAAEACGGCLRPFWI